MNVYITGGTGLLGAAVLEELIFIDEINEIHILYRDEAKKNLLEEHLKFNSKLKYLKGDLETIEFSGLGVDVILHFASLRNIEKCNKNPEETYRINVAGTKRLLTKAKEENIKKIIFASTQNVYNLQSGKNQTEKSEIKILNNYAKSKYEAELMIEMLCENQDYIIIRPSRIIGPSIFPNEDSVVGYVFFSKALKEKRIDLFGDIYRETNLIDNRDISKAIANLITSKKTIWNEIYNISSNTSVSINQVVEYIESWMIENGYSLIVNKEKLSEQGLDILIDNSKIKGTIDWKPKISIKQSVYDVMDNLNNKNDFK